MLFQRTLTAVSSLFLALVGTASAQSPVVLELSYQANGTPKTCIFTTDAGVSMNAASRLTASGTFGQNCPTSQVVGNPSFTNPLAGDIPSSVTVGTNLPITWSADADTCTYDGSTFPAGVTYTNWPTTGTACNGDCANLRTLSFPASVAGAYKFKLNCSKTGNPTPLSNEANTTATTAPVGCTGPTGTSRQTVGAVCDVAGQGCRNVDMTKFENVFGYNATQPSQPNLWPGTYNLQQRPTIANNTFLALQFTVPANFATNKYGYLGIAETNFQARMSMKISTTCGDLSPSTGNPKCLLNDGGASSQMLWSTYTSGPVFTGSCALTAGQTYYLHMIHAPLQTPAQSSCGPGSCANSIQNGPGVF
ncbi:MAG TPA: hypothetical protein VJ724_13420 [Tahibacter sp.]|nr:hypothetical protein [Tahibacter sp.]